MPSANVALTATATNPGISPSYLNPLDTSNLLVYFDMRFTTNYTAASGTVSVLDDLSGNANNLLQATGANQPALISSPILAGVEAIKLPSTAQTFLLGTTSTAINFTSSSAFTLSMIVQGGPNSDYPNAGHVVNNISAPYAQVIGWSLQMQRYYNGSIDTLMPAFYFGGQGGHLQVVAPGASANVAGSMATVGNFFVRMTYSGATGTSSDVKIYVNEVLQTNSVYSDTLSGISLYSAYSKLALGSPMSSTDAGSSPFLAGMIHAGVIAPGSSDAVTLHTFAQQQFSCA